MQLFPIIPEAALPPRTVASNEKAMPVGKRVHESCIYELFNRRRFYRPIGHVDSVREPEALRASDVAALFMSHPAGMGTQVKFV